jgi:hypothetical protein
MALGTHACAGCGRCGTRGAPNAGLRSSAGRAAQASSWVVRRLLRRPGAASWPWERTREARASSRRSQRIAGIGPATPSAAREIDHGLQVRFEDHAEVRPRPPAAGPPGHHPGTGSGTRPPRQPRRKSLPHLRDRPGRLRRHPGGQRIVGAFVSSAYGAATFYQSKVTQAKDLTMASQNDDRDEDRTGVAGLGWKGQPCENVR